MIQPIIKRTRLGYGGEQVFFPCGHHRFWSNHFKDQTEAECALCDTNVLYHGTSAVALLRILEAGYMWNQTPADDEEATALDFARSASGDTSVGVILTLDIKKARLVPSITGYYESESTVPARAITWVRMFRRPQMELIAEEGDLKIIPRILSELDPQLV